MCIDYRGLNAITVKNGEPLPRIDDLLDKVQGCHYNKIDLKSEYHQIAIRSEDQHKTAFQTRYGLYEFVAMPFGLSNAPGTFQHAMNQIFHDYLDKFVIAYLNDILIFSKTAEEHVAHLDKVLSLLRQHKFKINGEKCEFGRTRVLYLGHKISAEGLKPDDAKVASFRDWLRPHSVTKMRSSLAVTDYYSNFVKNHSIIVAPLTDLARLDTQWEWTDGCEVAFRHPKHALMHHEVLKLPDPDKPFVVPTDASQYGIGAVLAQQEGKKLRPAEYMSEKMPSQKLVKSTYEKELYAIFKALTHWGHYLLGSPQSVTEMRSFLGVTGYYSNFVKNHSIVVAPLTDLARLDTQWEWTDRCEVAFRHLKHALMHHEVLKLPDPDKPFVVTTDASQYGIGVVLAQQEGKKLRPAEYMSKKMPSQKLVKSTYEKELYAIFKALTHWRHDLLGRFLYVGTDHQTLKWMRTQPVLSYALNRWIEVIEQYDFEPQYIKGEYNKVLMRCHVDQISLVR
ncbi:hypothetical protein CBR_g4091 [Chara braunii]|uniref:Reverse transcriptase domain-containing protein n=1 Tax=Chara braunii TaxID=69332 RepID=A0A388KHB1_CHABU|nr:hypothetical protein CBR_g4091 [Chara braunii]|eukprot:GBG69398.1 hypothetical protein CBR_g4091 [Chara braunii]